MTENKDYVNAARQTVTWLAHCSILQVFTSK